MGLILQGQKRFSGDWYGRKIVIYPGIAPTVLLSLNITSENIQTATETLFEFGLKNSSEIDGELELQIQELPEPIFPSSHDIEQYHDGAIARLMLFKPRPYTQRVKRLIQSAKSLTAQFQQESIGTEHLLLALIQEGQELINGQSSDAVQILEALQIDLLDLQERVIQRCISPSIEKNDYKF